MSTREVPLKLSYGGELRRVRLNSHYGIIAFDVLVATAKASYPELAENKMQFTWLDDEHDTIVVTGDTELQEALVMMQGRPMIKFDVKSVGSAEAAPAAAPVPASVPAETLPVPEVIEVAQAAPVQADAKVEAEAIQEAFDSSASAVAGVSEAVEEVAVTEAAPATVEVDAVASAAVSVDQTGAVAIATNVKEESEAEVAVVSHTEVTETTTETHTVATDADTVLHTATEDVHVHVHTVTEVKDVHTHTVEQVIEVTEHHENHKETAEIAVQTESEDTDKLEVIVEAAGDEIPAPSPARTLSPVPAADSESDSTITSTANAAASATATPGTFLYELNFPTQSALGLTLLPYKLHYTASEVTHTVDICIVSQSTLTGLAQEGDFLVGLNGRCMLTNQADSVPGGSAAFFETVVNDIVTVPAPRTLRMLRVVKSGAEKENEIRDKDAVAALLAHFGQGEVGLFHPY